MTDPALRAFVDAHHDELIAFRRHVHAYPELSGQEVETTDLVAQRLAAAGLEPRLLDGGAGLVCDIGTGEGPVVALRADLDALAMEDEKDVPYRSHVPGVAHACGHDVHTTIVLGAGLALADRIDRGTVRLLFEPAEETVPGGAVDIIAAGGLDGVQAVFGFHCDPKLEVGKVGLRAGALTSSSDMVTVHLHGPGGHTARPHLTVDLVSVAGRVATEVPAIVAELGEQAGGDLLLVFGAIHAGNPANVIPATAELRGTLRTPDGDLWDHAQPLLEKALASVLAGTGATWRIDHTKGVPPVVNHDGPLALLADAVRAELGDDAITEAMQSRGGDSFAWYLQQVPGCFARLGTHDPARGGPLDLHASTFDVHESSIGIGVRVLARVALDTLSRL